MSTSHFIHDVKAIRARARQHIEEGAVTQGYGADRRAVVVLLNEALATELVCVLRYRRHYYMASGFRGATAAVEFLEHAVEEQAHADRIAQRIVQLGGEPDLNPDGLLSRSHSEYVPADSLDEMIREDLVAERIAIESYGEMIRYLADSDPTTRLLEEILAKEPEHGGEPVEQLARARARPGGTRGRGRAAALAARLARACGAGAAPGGVDRCRCVLPLRRVARAACRGGGRAGRAPLSGGAARRFGRVAGRAWSGAARPLRSQGMAMSATPSRELLEARLMREREELTGLLEDLTTRARWQLDLGRRIRERPSAWLLAAMALGAWLARR
jgi:bacterioferritin